MKNSMLFQTSTLWIIIILITSFTNPVNANTEHVSGFHLDDGIFKSSFKFKTVNSLIIIPVTIDCKKLNLIFDTGMNSILVFDKKSIKSWKEREKHIIHFSGLGNGNSIKGIRLDGISVEMPNINGEGLSIVVTPSTTFPKELNGLKIHGVFGYQLLSKFIVQVDYKNEIITLTDPAYFTPPKQVSVIDLNIANTKPYIKCPVIINQQRYLLNFLVDTGAESALILNRNSIRNTALNSKIEQIGIGLAGKFVGQKVTINNLLLGSYHVSQDFTAWVPTQKSYPNESPSIIRDGTIGGETLRKYIVTFDYFNSKLYLQSASTKTVFFNSGTYP